MDIQKATTIIVNALKVATKRGAFELEEAKLISDAIDALRTDDQSQKPVPGKKEKSSGV